MRYFDRYKHLLGAAYDDGDYDCYGLCRRFYLDNYEIELPDYARSNTFFSEGIDLIAPFLKHCDFKVVDVAPSNLEIGDGLIFCVPQRGFPPGTANHVGVFVGNGTFIHHPYGKESCEDYMTPSWSRRILAVVRHPDIGERNAQTTEKVQFVDALPFYAKHRLAAQAPGILDTAEGEVRTDP